MQRPIMELRRGQRLPLVEIFEATRFAVQIHCEVGPGIECDIVAFGLNASGKLHGDAWMIFYNQTEAPDEAIRLSPHLPQFIVDLERLPQEIARVSFCLALDGGATAQDLRAVDIRIKAYITAELLLHPSMFEQQRALMLLELYRHPTGWRINCVGQGFKGGLAALLQHYGGDVA